MSKKLKFLATVNKEGEHGSVRGKIPAGLVAALGVKAGGAIEFIVSGDRLVGADVLTPKEAKQARKEAGTESRFGPRDTSAKKADKGKLKKSSGKSSKDTSKKSSKKDKKAGKSGGKKLRRDTEDDWDTGPKKKAGKSAKSSKRRTEVTYDEPKKLKKGGKSKGGRKRYEI
jgi:hypothetical protein